MGKVEQFLERAAAIEQGLLDIGRASKASARLRQLPGLYRKRRAYAALRQARAHAGVPCRGHPRAALAVAEQVAPERIGQEDLAA